MDPKFPMRNTTLCYLEQDDAYLMLHRVTKKNDLNHDKWIGVGGKFEPFESPEDCLLREVQEETGLILTSYRCRGVVTFLLGELTEYMFLYTADAWTGTLVKDAARNEGILVSVIVGVALTLPISSAAICAALGLTGLAGGAAVAGCCAQMVGFAVMSYKENGVGGLVSQGLGTSMLQMGNIIKNPRIWIAPTLASAITGPLATCLFHFEMNGAAVSSGMGTCGLVGQIGVYTGWVNDIAAGTKAAITPMDWAAMLLICFVLPAVLSVVFCEIERKLGWIREGDLKLN